MKYRNYYHIKNNHILVQPDIDMWNAVKDEILSKHNQHIHIFELVPLTIQNTLEYIINQNCERTNKLFIHVPRMVRDTATVLDYMLKGLTDNPYRIITERKGASFTYNKDNKRQLLSIKYENDDNQYIIKLGDDIFCIRDIDYIIPNNKFLYIKTVPQRRYPDIFRDIIIKRFKQYTPPGILKSFNNDNEIFDFIKEELSNINEENEGDEDDE